MKPVNILTFTNVAKEEEITITISFSPKKIDLFF